MANNKDNKMMITLYMNRTNINTTPNINFNINNSIDPSKPISKM